jgi:hypothetical protein
METIHILYRERALCLFSSEFPINWPKDQKWVRMNLRHIANCEGCLAKVQEVLKPNSKR